MLSDLLVMSQPYLVTGYTDLRRGIDGLVGIITRETELGSIQQRGLSFLRKKTRPDQGAARNRRSRYPGDGDGFLLLYKRLDNGVFRWPRTETEALLLTEQQVRWLTEGLEIEQPKAIKPGKLFALEHIYSCEEPEFHENGKFHRWVKVGESLTPEGKKAERQRRSQPILEEFTHAWIPFCLRPRATLTKRFISL